MTTRADQGFLVCNGFPGMQADRCTVLKHALF